jgi:chemotaxis protein CheX
MRALADVDIARSTQNAWKAVFGSPLAPKNGAVSPSAAPRLVASIQILGNVPRVVVLDCPWEEARRVTAGFYNRDPKAVPEDLVKDMFGELVNMIGGQLKRFYPSSSRLSLPQVKESRASGTTMETGVLQKAAFESGPAPVTVILLEESPKVKE